MKIYRCINNILPEDQNAVIAIGNFDGIHLGHKHICDQVKTLAKQSGRKSAILTFEPHPHTLFQPDSPPARITPFTLKMQKLEEQGIDIAYVLDFNWEFASQSAEDFIEKILKQALGAAHIIVGYDFRFGQLRKGCPDMIKTAGLPTTTIEKIQNSEQITYSSSQIRQALRHGDMDQANTMLGWEWCLQGEVIKGDQRGRELGYPTANIALHDTIHPAYGVYATLTQIQGEDTWHMSATNIGIRPMFKVPTAQIETFIFDFDQDIYGKTITVKPIKRLRGEAKFESLKDLITQMDKDCAKARTILTPLIKQENAA